MEMITIEMKRWKRISLLSVRFVYNRFLLPPGLDTLGLEHLLPGAAQLESLPVEGRTVRQHLHEYQHAGQDHDGQELHLVDGHHVQLLSVHDGQGAQPHALLTVPLHVELFVYLFCYLFGDGEGLALTCNMCCYFCVN